MWRTFVKNLRVFTLNGIISFRHRKYKKSDIYENLCDDPKERSDNKIYQVSRPNYETAIFNAVIFPVVDGVEKSALLPSFSSPISTREILLSSEMALETRNLEQYPSPRRYHLEHPFNGTRGPHPPPPPVRPRPGIATQNIRSTKA